MNIYSIQNIFERLIDGLENYKNLNPPYSQQIVEDKSRMKNVLSSIQNITSYILEPTNEWEDSLNMAQSNIELNNVINCHSILSDMQSSITNSINNVSLQLSVIEGISEEVNNSLDVINQEFQSDPTTIDLKTYSNLKATIGSIFEELSNLSNFCETIINDMKGMNDTLNIGINPYNYDMYNSITILKMQITTSYSDNQSLRNDFFG